MRTISALILGVTLCVAAQARVAAQPSLQLRLTQAEVTLQESDDQVKQWASWAQISLWIVIGVGVLGIGTAVLQSVNVSWKAVATAVVGAVISLITVVNSTMVPADYRTLNQLVGRGTRLVNGARSWLLKGQKAPDDETKQFALSEIEKRMKEFATLSLSKETSAAPVGLFTVLYAAEQGNCGCLGTLPKPLNSDILSCASATGNTLSEAHEAATMKAAADIAATMARSTNKPSFPASSRDVIQYVRRTAEEFDSCPESGKDNTVWVVLRLSQTFRKEQAQTAFVSSWTKGEPTEQVKLSLSSIKTLQDGSSGPTDWSFDVLVDGKVVTQIPSHDYTDRTPDQTVTFGPGAVTAAIDVPKDRFWVLEIRGKRKIGGDTAVGAAAVNDVGSAVQIPVTNKNINNGSFVFSVNLSKQNE